MLSGYIQDMTALVMLKGWDSMMLVDRNDIWVNMKQIKGNVSDTSELDVNKTCLKQAVFTGCVRLDVLQNRFPAGNGSAPSPAWVRSIFS